MRPLRGKLPHLVDAPLPEAAPAVVWIDDVQYYAHDAFADTLEELLDAGAVVVGTIRQAAINELTTGRHSQRNGRCLE